jgi:hypothetical protein
MVSGMLRKISDMEGVYNTGSMGVNMKATGKMIKRTQEAGLSTQMVTYTMENGMMIKHMGMAPIPIPMEQGMKEIGKKINKMV